jgi:hypothetical protein
MQAQQRPGHRTWFAGDAKGSWPIESAQPSDGTGLILLFAAGRRPTRAALRDFSKISPAISVSYDPLEATTSLYLVDAQSSPEPSAQISPVARDDQPLWLELLCSGLGMDVIGIAPGPCVGFPEINNQFDLPQKPTVTSHDAVRLAPGQHLVAAENSPPVAKALIALARDLVHHFEDLEAVYWPASRSAIGRRFFESTTTAWLEGGPFPALGLTAFKESMDGAIQTSGLDFWIGQELRIEPPLSYDKVAATRLGVRIVNQLVLVGGLEQAERIVAPDGSRLLMRPSRNGKFVRVWHE